MKAFVIVSGFAFNFVIWAALVLVALAGLPRTGFCQDRMVGQETRFYAAQIAADGRAEYVGRRLDLVYWELIRRGWKPLNAYRGTYVYDMGHKVGYRHGVVLGMENKRLASEHEEKQQWETFYKQQEWSKTLWGIYQQGYADGGDRGLRVGRRQEAGPVNAHPPLEARDVFRYQRTLGIDPDDPFSDLRIREVITGPLGR